MESPSKPERLASLDAYRGLIMLSLVSNGFGIKRYADKNPSPFWTRLGGQFDHVPWVGCVYWDLIQPAFMFMVGAAAAYSVNRRRERGDSFAAVLRSGLLRSCALVLLGVFLASNGEKETSFVFTNVLAQIGLGYLAVALLAGSGAGVQLGAAAGVLVASWALFIAYPVPTEVSYAAVGVTEADIAGGAAETGLFAHWNKGTNLAADIDLWFLNLFPRSTPYTFNKGGYQTLNFLPAITTMLLGLWAGELLRSTATNRRKLSLLMSMGFGCIAAGWLLGYVACPLVKRIWTPSFALYSGGLVLWGLAIFFAIMDILGWKRLAFPLVVLGMNSMLVYMISQLAKPWILGTWKTHAGVGFFTGPYSPLLESAAVTLTVWLLCYWLYRQRVFLRL